MKAGVLENHTSRDLSGHDSFRVASKQTKNKVLVKTERKKKQICLRRSLHAAAVTAGRALSEYASESLSGWKIKPVVPSNRLFSRSDGDKLFSKPLDFERL